MARTILFTLTGIVFGAAVGCIAGLGLCYILRELAAWDMPLGRIVPISSVAAAVGAIVLGIVEFRRERQAAA